MASIWVEKNGKTYRIRELVGGKKVDLATGYETKTAAKKAAIHLKAAALRGDELKPRSGEVTMAELAAMFWEAIGPTLTRVKSHESTAGVLDRYITRLLGDLDLAHMSDPSSVQRWVNDLSAGRTKPSRGKPRPLSPKTVRNAHGLLHQLFDWAITNRYMRRNPCKETRLPDEVFNEHTYLTPAEADRLIAALDPHWRPLVLFLLATGCRWSEALGVRAKYLDVLAGKVTFLKKWIEDKSGHFHEEDVKSRRGRRTASFPTAVTEVLIPLTISDDDDRERHIFLTKRGTDRLRHKDFYADVWYPAREAIGMPGLTVHDLRHTHVAWLIAGNVPLSAISRRLGHKSILVTDAIYGHLLEEVDQRLVATLDQAMQVIDFRGILGETAPVEPPSTPSNPGRTPG